MEEICNLDFTGHDDSEVGWLSKIMKKTIHLYSEEFLFDIIKDILFEYEILHSTLGDINDLNFKNTNTLLVLKNYNTHEIKKSFFSTKATITNKNVSRFISHMAPCIEVVGYRQKKKGIKSFGDLSSDFGANVKFLIGQKKKYKKINISNLKTIISNKKINQTVPGNTGAVYISPLNSLRFVLNKLKKDKINLDKDFYVFTGSTVGVVPILGKGLYSGKIDKLGSVKAIIH